MVIFLTPLASMSQTRALNQRIAGPHLHVLDLHWKSTHQQHLWPSPPWEISGPSEQCFRTPALWCNRRAAPAKLPSCSLSRGSKQTWTGFITPQGHTASHKGKAMFGTRSGFRPQPPQVNAAVDVQLATSPKPLTEQNDGEGSGISLLVCTMLSQSFPWH